jgi:hypothetical protein
MQSVSSVSSVSGVSGVSHNFFSDSLIISDKWSMNVTTISAMERKQTVARVTKVAGVSFVSDKLKSKQFTSSRVTRVTDVAGVTDMFELGGQLVQEEQELFFEQKLVSEEHYYLRKYQVLVEFVYRLFLL